MKTFAVVVGGLPLALLLAGLGYAVVDEYGWGAFAFVFGGSAVMLACTFLLAWGLS